MLKEEVATEYVALGAILSGGNTIFRVWSPAAEQLDVHLSGGDLHAMERLEGGYFETRVPGICAGTLYTIRLNADQSFPDPASRFQPEGVHGRSMVVDPGAFSWTDGGWQGISRGDLVFYELHVGTFSPEGSFAGVRERLSHLKQLGITAIELMPVADFPGRWNWGYDHAALYAPSRAYGRPDDLRRLVDEAHRLGMAVFLDVIYNHLGPDGAYVAAFGPMFTEKHSTPWGVAVNLDDDGSEGVRNLFIDNALHWLREYHVDGLRLDATHALIDDSPVHFLEELSIAVDDLRDGPDRILIAEDSRNLNTLIRPRSSGGYGLDGVWADDFHHQVRHMTAGDSEEYFAHFAGMDACDLAETVERGWFYDGRPSRYSGESRGTDASLIEPDQCVICIQNHDQVGNRPLGSRLNHDVPTEVYRAISALLLFAPELPLLFMGQEWAARSPFLFFTDHNEELGPLVTEGRKKEFEGFSGFKGDVPDPQDPETFVRSKLNWVELDEPASSGVLQLYREMLELRRRLSGLAKAKAHGGFGLSVRRGRYELLVALRNGVRMPVEDGFELILDSQDERYAPGGVAPEIVGAELRFARPGAVVLRHRTSP